MPPKSERVRFVFLRMGILVSAATLPAFFLRVLPHGHFSERVDLVGDRANAGGRDCLYPEVGVSGAKLGFGGGKF